MDGKVFRKLTDHLKKSFYLIEKDSYFKHRGENYKKFKSFFFDYAIRKDKKLFVEHYRNLYF